MIDTEKLSRLLEELNIAVDGYAAQRLDLYAQRLVAWNEKMNLTGITDPDGILEKHFIDSIEPLRFVEIPRNARVIDVGTGAGFPGLPLLIARPDLDLTLADSLHKRLVFLMCSMAAGWWQSGCMRGRRFWAKTRTIGSSTILPLPERWRPCRCCANTACLL